MLIFLVNNFIEFVVFYLVVVSVFFLFFFLLVMFCLLYNFEEEYISKVKKGKKIWLIYLCSLFFNLLYKFLY